MFGDRNLCTNLKAWSDACLSAVLRGPPTGQLLSHSRQMMAPGQCGRSEQSTITTTNRLQLFPRRSKPLLSPSSRREHWFMPCPPRSVNLGTGDFRLVQKHQCCWLRGAFFFFFCPCQWPLSPKQRTPNMLGAEGSQKKHKLISQCACAYGCAYNHHEVTD